MNDKCKQYLQLIAKCWDDEAFKQKLLADPAGTLKAEGIAVRAGTRLQVAENTPQDFTIVIPVMPTDLPDELLGGVAGGCPAILICHGS